jgi:hypothetical protein
MPGKKPLNIIGIVFISAAFGLVVWFVAPVIPESFVQRLDRGATTFGFLLTCLTVGLATVGWFLRQDLRRWLRRTRFEDVGAPFAVPEREVLAVVIPVSQHQPPEWILRHLQPRFVSFLYTEQRRDVAAKLAEQFAGSVEFFPSLEQIKEGSLQLNNVDDPNESKRLVKQFLQRFVRNGVERRQLFVDTTGGKVPMSIGAFLAAEEMDVSSIYIVGIVNGRIENVLNKNEGRALFMSNRLKV